jgi:hypothetical protein
MEALTEPVVLAAHGAEAAEEDEDANEPSIFGCLKRGVSLVNFCTFLFFSATIGSTCGTLFHGHAIVLAVILRSYDVSHNP